MTYKKAISSELIEMAMRATTAEPSSSSVRFMEAALSAQDEGYNGPVVFQWNKREKSIRAVFNGDTAEQALASVVRKLEQAGLALGRSRGILPFAELKDVMCHVAEHGLNGHLMYARDNLLIDRRTDGSVALIFE